MPLICLVGMPGAGKTTLGDRLARRLRLPFLDSDDAIEHKLGGSIRDYFSSHGESAFRDLEQQVIGELSARRDGVLATGGGSVLRAANREALAAAATVIYLRATPAELFRRLRHDTDRPLLLVPDPLQRLRELYAERDKLYVQTAHFVMETARVPIPTLVNRLVMQLELGGAVDPGVPMARPARR